MNLDERAQDVWAEISQQVSTIERPSAGAIVRRSRRGRVATRLAALAVLAITGVGLAVARQDDPGPTPLQVTDDPEPTSTTTVVGWSPERTRDEGSPVGFLAGRDGPSPSGLDAEVYCTGPAIPTGSPCDHYHSYDPEEEQHWAVEVTQGEQSALFEVRGPPIAEDFDEDSLLVQDGTDQDPRFRLLQADGTATPLRVVSDLAPAAPGPDVILIEDLAVYRRGSFGPDDPLPQPHLVDDDAGTLQRLDVPEEVRWWGVNVDEILWGGNGCRAVWQQPDGSFDHHDACSNPLVGHTDPEWNWPGFADWLEPGRMALVEWGEDGEPRVLHASLDRGATWSRIEIDDRASNGSLAMIEAALADAVQQLG